MLIIVHEHRLTVDMLMARRIAVENRKRNTFLKAWEKSKSFTPP